MSIKTFNEQKSAHLLITPVTIMKQWKSELIAWNPMSYNADNVYILHEFADQETRDYTIQRAIDSQGVLIASYELVRIHSESFVAKYWSYIILDEGQKIKNP